LSIALTGKKVAIIELDLRRPKVYQLLKLQREPGITNYLSDKASLKEIIKDVENFENLKVVTAGVIPGNPAEIILSDKFADLIGELKLEFDYFL
jgi:Mrp family chromosome partitioning ATPase